MPRCLALGDLQGRLLLPPDLRSVVGSARPRSREGETWTLGEFVPDHNGAFVARHLLPRRCELSVIMNDAESSWHGLLDSLGTFDVQPGDEVLQRFEFPQGQRQRLQLVSRDRRPLGNTNCTIEAGRSSVGVTTDDSRRVVLDRDPAGPFHVLCGLDVSAPIQVPGQSGVELSVAVPTSDA